MLKRLLLPLLFCLTLLLVSPAYGGVTIDGARQFATGQNSIGVEVSFSWDNAPDAQYAFSLHLYDEETNNWTGPVAAQTLQGGSGSGSLSANCTGYEGFRVQMTHASIGLVSTSSAYGLHENLAVQASGVTVGISVETVDVGEVPGDVLEDRIYIDQCAYEVDAIDEIPGGPWDDCFIVVQFKGSNDADWSYGLQFGNPFMPEKGFFLDQHVVSLQGSARSTRYYVRVSLVVFDWTTGAMDTIAQVTDDEAPPE